MNNDEADKRDEEEEMAVRTTWQGFHSSRGGGGGGGGDLARPPLVRLKTPPLLSHPMFRNGGSGMYSFRHLSLPAELTRSKMESD